jgi:hypothetical protein
MATGVPLADVLGGTFSDDGAGRQALMLIRTISTRASGPHPTSRAYDGLATSLLRFLARRPR